jgi:hypothetical protein
VGSNPTPRASNEGFVANIIRKETCKKKKTNLTYQTPQTTQGSKDYDKVTLEKTIDKMLGLRPVKETDHISFLYSLTNLYGI